HSPAPIVTLKVAPAPTRATSLMAKRWLLNTLLSQTVQNRSFAMKLILATIRARARSILKPPEHAILSGFPLIFFMVRASGASVVDVRCGVGGSNPAVLSLLITI